MEVQDATQRGNWGSKLAFVFAASGSAIGLGSMWRFPLKVGQNGGAVFVLAYIIAVVFIGFTIMLAELTMGRHTQKNPVGVYKALKPKTPWKLAGAVAIFTCVAIFSYYAVVCGWAFGYLYKIIAGKFSGDVTWQLSESIFSGFASNTPEVFFCLFVVMAVTIYIVSKGISGGIEKWSKILMPVLFGLIIILAIRAVTLGGAETGLSFYLKPDLSKFNTDVLFYAVGQAFYSLSLGMGIMMTYGSYISKKENLVSSAGWVCFSTTFVAFLTGIIIFPTLFATPGINPGEFEVSTGLMFQVFPIVISKIPGGYIFGILFFFLLLVAAITSTISLLEVPVAYFIDEKKWPRKKAALLVGIFTFLLAVPSALSEGSIKFLTDWQFFAKMDFLFGNFILAAMGLIICFFLVYVWKIKNALAEISQGAQVFRFKPLWVFNIKFLAPVVLILILIFIRKVTG
ncbi:MAG: sodium-dependent transporter [Candidatus Aminicenantes bacterium]|nr:sodium-dependent transporter [Candidatus Aminicenantes bacterium]